MRERKKVNYCKRILISLISFLTIWLLFYIIFSGKRRENPPERNRLIFENDNIKNVIDSMKRFEEIMREFPFPKDKDLNTTGFSYHNGDFSINNKKIGKLLLDTLKADTTFSKFTDEQILEFINLFKYLAKNNAKPAIYHYDDSIMIYRYRDYYDMYHTFSYDDDLVRSLILIKSRNDLNLELLYKVLDFYDNLYLLAHKDAEIWEDSKVKIKYKKRNPDDTLSR